RQGEVLPKSLIASQVWGMNFASDTDVIEVAIRRLRAKVDDGFAQPLIQTVRGMGYVLEARASCLLPTAGPCRSPPAPRPSGGAPRAGALCNRASGMHFIGRDQQQVQGKLAVFSEVRQGVTSTTALAALRPALEQELQRHPELALRIEGPDGQVWFSNRALPD